MHQTAWDGAGYPGDEDNGNTTAWYIFASIGLYPICPGKADHTVTTPLVENIGILGRPLVPPRNTRIIAHEDLLK